MEGVGPRRGRARLGDAAREGEATDSREADGRGAAACCAEERTPGQPWPGGGGRWRAGGRLVLVWHELPHPAPVIVVVSRDSGSPTASTAAASAWTSAVVSSS